MWSKAAIEPLMIAGIFTLGCLMNRRRSSSTALPRDLERGPPNRDIACRGGSHSNSSISSSDSISPPLKPVVDADAVEVYGAGARRLPLFWDLLSRFWNKYPFLPEIWYWNLTYWVYQLLRAYSARKIAGNQYVFDLALFHARQILSLERLLSIDVELGSQRYFIDFYPEWIPLLARIYYCHICVGVAFIVYCYTFLPRSKFYRIRRTIALDNAIAFIIVTTWRCTPPRLMPWEYGYVDVLHKNMGGGGTAWTNNRFQLTIAAMPSLHFGTALFFAVCLFRFAPHRLVRWMALLWPVAMLITILATANHFVLDAVVGALVPVLGWEYADLMGMLHELELKLFGPIRKRMDIKGDRGLEGDGVDAWKRSD